MTKNLRQPPFLKKGDKIAIISTARKIVKEEISIAIKELENWGLEIVLGKTIGLEQNQFAGSDQERAADLQEMLNRKDISAILCARGGYGTIRVLEHIDFTGFTENPKWIAGYSDVCVLHAHINNYLGIQTIHSTMPINFITNTKESILSLKSTLFGNDIGLQFPTSVLNKVGQSSGIIIGGNLSILYSLLGTESGFNTDNKILLLEDLDEYLYHVDRMMLALKRANKLKNLKGLIVGGMTAMNDNKIPFGKNALEIILEHCSPYEFPICFDAPIGHINDNRSIYFGKTYELNVTKNTVSLKLS